jgi:hypothetical protein
MKVTPWSHFLYCSFLWSQLSKQTSISNDWRHWVDIPVSCCLSGQKGPYCTASWAMVQIHAAAFRSASRHIGYTSNPKWSKTWVPSPTAACDASLLTMDNLWSQLFRLWAERCYLPSQTWKPSIKERASWSFMNHHPLKLNSVRSPHCPYAHAPCPNFLELGWGWQ